ncbi:SRPBCC family protein [Aquihabitans sp. McL0605]|uniref:SRPBCC family protein n=1 Tax=Aquihabitans sp. McL0605 TaxID=3415671 RepID=UPI003CEC17F1
MYDIHHRIGINAPMERVHHALTTTEGLASWWTTDTQGDPTVGGKLVFTFGSPDRSASFEVLEVADDRIVWRGIAGPDEWIDTTCTFQLTQEGDETVLFFTHGDWREAVPFIGHCTTKWGTFLLGLKALLEGGRSCTYPDELVISSWDH